jgi:biopolymer transport protein ExbD
MKIGKGGGMPDQVSFDMTPMIDCCFQLIIFFMLSMKIFAPEGDFNVKMPIAASEGMPDPSQLPPIKVRMKSDGAGRLVSLTMGTRTIAGKGEEAFGKLRREILGIVGDDRGPNNMASKTEIELDCDPQLHYEYVIRAVTAVSGYIGPNKEVVKLVEKIKFAPRRAE